MIKRTFNLLQSVAITLVVPTIALGQYTPPETSAAPTYPAPTDSAPVEQTAPPVLLKQEELDQLLAPIALYPDSVLSQIFMASTYPLEIVQADRWAKDHADLKGEALAAELEKQDWDPSVRSLVNFPQVLAMMSEKLDLTIKLGDTFLAQQADVMNTVQNLRAKAQGEGQLTSNKQQNVTVTAPPPAEATTIVVNTTTPPAQIITIESTQPDVIYVPTYDPVVVYGGWPYPSYPPAPYYPPGYVAGAVVSFGVGVACGAAWGYAWGNCNWGGNDIDIDVDRNFEFNGDINRNEFKGEFNRNNVNANGRSSFQHDPAHRKGVAYRDNGMSQKYGGSTRSERDAMAREQYRGRAEQGRQDINQQGADRVNQDMQRGGDRSADRSGDRSANQNRSDSSARSRDSGNSSGAFSDVDRGGSSARSDSNRGSSSRASSGGSRGGGSRSSGGSRGGGSRGGGGRGR